MDPLGFQSLIGRLQTMPAMLMTDVIAGFQSLIGRLQTREFDVVSETPYGVSIPHR